MSERKLLDRILSVPRVANKLLVTVGGNASVSRSTRAAVPLIIGSTLLSHCRVPPSDIHDSSNSKGRSNTRDENGANCSRTFLVGKQRVHRPREMWDTAPFCDYRGLWCDRLLLGEPPTRCALLLPQGPAGESLELVLQSQRQFMQSPNSTMLLAATDRLQKGELLFEAVGGEHMEVLLPHHEGVQACVALLDRVHGRGDQVDVLWVGVGSDVPMMRPMDAADTVYFASDVVPVVAFFAAMWASSPLHAKDAVNKHQWQRWSAEQRDRILTSMQQSMISTRNEHLLRAYVEGRPASLRMNMQSTIYEAAKVLEELQGHER
jgi:hypothetical protein